MDTVNTAGVKPQIGQVKLRASDLDVRECARRIQLERTV